jgi:TatD DNase family protein
VIDFHCHLDLYDDPQAVVEQIRSSGSYVLSVTTTPKAFLGSKRLAGGNKRIQTALGFHPQVVHERQNELHLIDHLMPQARYVGEIGLDGSRGFREHLDIQEKVFRYILKAGANAGGRVMSIHSRSAATRLLDILEENPRAGVPVLHWFSGSQAELLRAVEMGAWFSVGPAMMRSMKGRELVAAMPRRRVLTETDGPFASVEGRALTPEDTRLAVIEIARVWGVQPGEVDQAVTANFRSICEMADSCYRELALA